MITVVIAGYILAALLTARWMCQLNVKAGNIDTTSLNDIAFNSTMAIVIALFWPLVLPWLGAVRFIAQPPEGGNGQ